MEHQHHFLTRLDRVKLPHVERALELYRDPVLVRFILAQAKVPEGSSRVAISLVDPVTGPFLIVTRDGKFVTCLGEGMRARGLPVITAPDLQGAITTLANVRTRHRVLREVAPEFGGRNAVLARLFTAGDDLSREELIGSAALAPLFRLELFKLYLETINVLKRTEKALWHELKRSDRLKGKLTRALHPYYGAQLGLGHILVLLGFNGTAMFASLDDEGRARLASISWTIAVMLQGIASTTLRAMWSAARIGKLLLPGYKALRASPHLLVAFDASLALIAIGARHGRLSAEVKKVLAQPPAIPEEERDDWYRLTMEKLLVTAAAQSVDEQREKWIAVGRKRILELECNDPKGSTYAYERPEDIPDDIALAMNLWNTDSWFDQGPLARVCSCVPWVGKAKIEEIYLPRGFIRAYRRPFQPEDALAILRTRRDTATTKPSTPKPAVSRSGPCPCNSGKKFKRCCAGRDVSA